MRSCLCSLSPFWAASRSGGLPFPLLEGSPNPRTPCHRSTSPVGAGPRSGDDGTSDRLASFGVGNSGTRRAPPPRVPGASSTRAVRAVPHAPRAPPGDQSPSSRAPGHRAFSHLPCASSPSRYLSVLSRERPPGCLWSHTGRCGGAGVRRTPGASCCGPHPEGRPAAAAQGRGASRTPAKGRPTLALSGHSRRHPSAAAPVPHFHLARAGRPQGVDCPYPAIHACRTH